MTTGIHECDGLKETEKFHQEFGDLIPTMPLTVCVTMARRIASSMPLPSALWFLGMSRDSTMYVAVRFCPFCGCELTTAGAGSV